MSKPAVLASIVMLGGLSGCVDQPKLASNQDGLSYEELYELVQDRREPGTGYYIVDWDLVLRSDRELLEYWGRTQQGALAIYALNNVDVKWNATQKKNLTYCVGASFGANKQKIVDGLRAATENGWEKFADVNFIYVPAQDANCTPANTNVVFDVNQVNANGEFLARAFFPNTARRDRNVLVDPSSFSPNLTIPLTNILAHELGHVLGFRHEHTRADGNAPVDCIEDADYRSLTPYDAASVMHYPQCNGTSTTLAFTQRDQDGVRAVYGAPAINASPMSQVTAPADGATVPPSFTVEASVVDTDLVKAELFVDDAPYQTVTAAPYRFQVTGLATGEHTLRVVGTDGTNQTGEQVITVTVARGTGGGDGDGGGDGQGDDGASTDVTGGCSAGGSGAGLLLGLGVLGLGVLGRRRRK